MLSLVWLHGTTCIATFGELGRWQLRATCSSQKGLTAPLKRVTKLGEKRGSGFGFFFSSTQRTSIVPFLSCFTCFCFKRKSCGFFSSCRNDCIFPQPLKELAQLPMRLSGRGRAVWGSCRASGGTPHLPGPCSCLRCPATCSKVSPVQGEIPWSFANQSWKGRDFRQGGIEKLLCIEIILLWPVFLGRL